jgi:hypothetical protein
LTEADAEEDVDVEAAGLVSAGWLIVSFERGRAGLL